MHTFDLCFFTNMKNVKIEYKSFLSLIINYFTHLFAIVFLNLISDTVKVIKI
jgi:hypothetical protein